MFPRAGQLRTLRTVDRFPRICRIRHKVKKLLPLEITLTNGVVGPDRFTGNGPELCEHIIDTNYRVLSLEVTCSPKGVKLMDIFLDRDGSDYEGCYLLRQCERNTRSFKRRSFVHARVA